jgi:hypothetical protein
MQKCYKLALLWKSSSLQSRNIRSIFFYYKKCTFNLTYSTFFIIGQYKLEVKFKNFLGVWTRRFMDLSFLNLPDRSVFASGETEPASDYTQFHFKVGRITKFLNICRQVLKGLTPIQSYQFYPIPNRWDISIKEQCHQNHVLVGPTGNT